MNSRDWQDMASVYRAGADKSRQRVMNIDRCQEAEVLGAMADRCEEVARSKNWELPLLRPLVAGRAWERIRGGSSYVQLAPAEQEALWAEFAGEMDPELPRHGAFVAWLKVRAYRLTGTMGGYV